ncbi:MULTISPECIES: NusA N-terminal domain-containing protein [Paracoccaceae]|uniref:NusA N-terminal domain-containing protein n=2 Tax=Paracoccaceae TaxID=31989 RepID=UPI003297616B
MENNITSSMSFQNFTETLAAKAKSLDITIHDLLVEIEREIISETQENYGSQYEYRVKINQDKGRLQLAQVLEVIEFVTDPNRQLSLDKAISLDPTLKVGDLVANQIEPIIPNTAQKYFEFQQLKIENLKINEL